MDLPRYCIVGARPVKAVPTPEGGMNILVFEWETGDFKRDMSYVERIALPDEEVDIVSEEEFNRQVEELRAQRQT